MPQFDILTLGSQIFGLLLSLTLFYYYHITVVLPHFTEIKKFRTKKLVNSTFTVKNTQNRLNNYLWLVNNNYTKFLS